MLEQADALLLDSGDGKYKKIRPPLSEWDLTSKVKLGLVGIGSNNTQNH